VESPTTLPTCYRHPDRETRLSCSHCDRPVCYDCVRTADVGQRCPECSKPAPQVREVRAVRSGTRAPVTMVLLGLSVAVYFIANSSTQWFALFYGSFSQINEAVAAGEWWRLISAAFLHESVRDTGSTFPLHLVFNMWALWVFGPELERSVGRMAFLGLYFAAAVGGGAAYYLSAPTGRAVGASGAIFGLFGAWLVAAYRQRHTSWGQASFRQLLVLLGINLALPLLPGSNIAWQAHLGGLAVGVLLAAGWSVPAVARHEATRAALAVGLLLLSFTALLV
jgi:membrane associated rhomboid family serine protease